MKFAVRTIKNQFHPLKVDDNANIKHGTYAIVRTVKNQKLNVKQRGHHEHQIYIPISAHREK